MSREIPKSLNDVKHGWVWRDTQRFLARPLRITTISSSSRSRHFAGGPSPHKGSKCAACKKRLTLLWDLDLGDPVIPDDVRNGFSPATRLPLYMCLQCAAASYTVSSDSMLKTFSDLHERLEEDESPFQETATELDRRPIAMTPISSTIDALLSLADTLGYDELDEPAQRTLKEYSQGKIHATCDLSISQIGGQPLVNQGHQKLTCPNPKCPASKLKHPYPDSLQKYLMKEMALIHWKEEPILEEFCFQFLFSVCAVCFAIRGECRCD